MQTDLYMPIGINALVESFNTLALTETIKSVLREDVICSHYRIHACMHENTIYACNLGDGLV
jgi:hypothetical protein